VVIAAVLLAGAILLVCLAGVRIASGGSHGSRDAAILANALAGVREYRSPPLPVIHPLAATAMISATTTGLLAPHPFGGVAPACFQRAGSGGFVRGVAVAGGPRDDDLLVGYREPGDVPQLFGLRRDHLRILGATADWIESRPASPDPVGAGDPVLEMASMRAVRAGLGGRIAVLESFAALATTPAPDTGAWMVLRWRGPLGVAMQHRIDVQGPLDGAYDPAHRVWLDLEAAADGWRPGRLRLDGRWVPYRIRGTSLVDSYGNEILYRLVPGDGPVFTTAGPDGCFVIHPGTNGAIDTTVATWDGTPATLGGDDRDAAADNLVGE
jgi:hypothetical protein